MSYRCWLRRLLLLLFVGGLLGLVGPASLWAQTASGLPELHPVSLIFTPPSPVDPTTTSVVVATSQVVNTGSASAGSFKVQFSYCPQSQVSVCSDSDYHNFGTPNTVPGLGVGGQVSVSAVLDISSLGFGLFRIRVVVNPDHQVAELDPNNNEMTALLTIGASPGSSAISALAVDNRRTSGTNAVYVGTMSGIVTASTFDSCNTQGCTTQIWQFTESQRVINAILLDNNRGAASSHNIYVASDDGTVYALAADAQGRSNQPSVLWRFSPNSRSPSPIISLALSRQSTAAPQGSASGTPADALLIYAGTQDGFVYAIRPDGSLRWFFNNSLARSGSVAINALAVDKNNQLFVGTANGLVYAIKPDTDLFGQIQAKWNSLTQSNQPFGAINVLAIDDFGTTLVYAGSDDKNAYSLFGDSGQLNWQFNTDISRTQVGGAVKALGVDLQTTGALYVGTASNFVYGLPFLANNAGKARPSTDGKLCVTAQGPITAITVDPSPAPGFGAIALAASQDRNLYVLTTQVTGGSTFQGCASKTTLSSTSRQNPNSSPIGSTGPLIAAPDIVTLTDTQLRAAFFGANSIVKFEVRYENQ